MHLASYHLLDTGSGASTSTQVHNSPSSRSSMFRSCSRAEADDGFPSGAPRTSRPFAIASTPPRLSSVYTHHRRRSEATVGLDAADAVPGVLCRRLLAHALVALLEARDEQFL